LEKLRKKGVWGEYPVLKKTKTSLVRGNKKRAGYRRGGAILAC
jgi:hypothetical protein